MALNLGKNQLFTDGGIFSDTREDGSVNVWDGNRWITEDLQNITQIQGTLELWEAADGNGSTAIDLNDGNYGNTRDFSTNDECSWTFTILLRLKRIRLRSGYADGAATFKFQYWNLTTQLWENWITNVLISNANDTWTDYISGTGITTNKIKLICTDEGVGDFTGLTQAMVIY